MRAKFALSLSLLAVLIVLSNVTVGRADTVVPSDRVTNYVTVRKTATSQSPPVGRLRPGEQAEYLGDAPHRHHIRLANGVEGYVSKSWTRRVPSAAPVAGSLEIHFIDVGQGDSTLVLCPNGRSIFVDAGSISGAEEDAIRDYILGQLDEHERRINMLVITHPDRDHYNLLAEVLRGVPIDHIYRVGDLEDYRQSFQEWLNDFAANNVTVLQSGAHNPVEQPNQRMNCGGAQVWILTAAVEANKSRKNAMSIVLMVRYGDFEAILTGDATRDTENVIIGRYPAAWLDVDVLKIGHHGSLATSTGVPWASTVKPRTAVVSAAYVNGFGHPRKEVIERLDDFTVDTDPHMMRTATGTKPNYIFENVDDYRESIYSTAVSGNVIVTSGGNGYAVTIQPHE